MIVKEGQADIPEEEYARIEILNSIYLRTYPKEKQIIVDVKIHTVSGRVIDFTAFFRSFKKIFNKISKQRQ
jgi:hypothetical protein